MEISWARSRAELETILRYTTHDDAPSPVFRVAVRVGSFTQTIRGHQLFSRSLALASVRWILPLKVARKSAGWPSLLRDQRSIGAAARLGDWGVRKMRSAL